MGEYIGPFFAKFGIDPKLGDFFNLMPEVDLEEIERVGNEIWGTDREHDGAITGALDHAVNQLQFIRDEVTDEKTWRGDAATKFKERLDIEQGFLDKAGDISQNVGQALVKFAETADSGLADGIGMLVGVIGAIVGAVVGSVIPVAGTAAGAIAGGLLGLVIGVSFAYYGVMVPKIVSALKTLDELAGQMPPDYPT